MIKITPQRYDEKGNPPLHETVLLYGNASMRIRSDLPSLPNFVAKLVISDKFPRLLRTLTFVEVRLQQVFFLKNPPVYGKLLLIMRP